MKQNGFRKFVSVLLALVLTLGLALPAMAADGSGEQGSKLSFEQVSADEYNVGLSRRDEVSTEETEEPLYEDTDIVRVSIVLEDASTLEKGFTADEIAAFSSDAMAYRQSLQNEQEAMESAISRQALDGEDLDVVWNLTLAAFPPTGNMAIFPPSKRSPAWKKCWWSGAMSPAWSRKN